MASHGVIERNTFRRLKMSAVTIGAEYEFWREAGWAEDVTIRNNRCEGNGRWGIFFDVLWHLVRPLAHMFRRTVVGMRRSSNVD